jgi:L-threonylcarbamoyladenylate synthase
MKVLNITPESIIEAGIAIQNGNLVAFPTETVYGLGADGLNPSAVAKIFEAKERPKFDPLILHISTFTDIKRLCLNVNEKAKKLIKEFWPGPLTVIMEKSSHVPDIVTSGLQTVAMRMQSHPAAQALINAAGTPIAAPSANLFGQLSSTTVEHVVEQLKNRIDIILHGGEVCSLGVESTVISFVEKEPMLLRHGALPIEEIENIIGKVKILKLNHQTPQSPGQLLSHYSPRTRLRILKKDIEPEVNNKKGFLAFTPPKEILSFEAVEVLTQTGDLREAATNLFSCLHRLDKAGLDIIYAEQVPEINIGNAIMDRLYKAEGIKNE